MSNRSRASSASQQGFTLVELAISLFIIGLIFGGGFLVGAQYLKAQKVTQTQAKIALIQNALSAYAQAHYRIPCPADPSQVPANTLNYGTEVDGADCLGNKATTTALMTETEGVVPWKELGIPQDDAVDGWNHYITYKPSPQLTVNNTNSAEQDANNTSAAVVANNYANPNIDIHNACRTPLWYDADGNHLNRGKALFCCNQAPVNGYTGPNAANNSASGWRLNGVTDTVSAEGQVPSGNNMNPGTPVAMTNNWHDADVTDQATIDGLHGSFVGYNDTVPQPPLMRATGLAVTLISHGGSGDLAFLPEQGGGANGALPLFGGASLNKATGKISNANGDAQVKQDNTASPQVFAGVFGHPKVSDSSFNLLFNTGNDSDEIVSYLRSDDLFGRVGSNSCQRPPPALAPLPCIPVQMTQSNNQTYYNPTNGAQIKLPTIGIQPQPYGTHPSQLEAVATRALKDQAGYNNSFGVYTIGTDGSINNVQIMTENEHQPAVGDPSTAKLSVAASQNAIGNFILSDGYDINNQYADIDKTNVKMMYDFGQADARTANITDPNSAVTLVGYNTKTNQYVPLHGADGADGQGYTGAANGNGVINMYSPMNANDFSHIWANYDYSGRGNDVSYVGLDPTNPNDTTHMQIAFEDLSNLNCYLTYTDAGSSSPSKSNTTCNQTKPPPKPANSTTHQIGDAVIDQYGGYMVNIGDNTKDDVVVKMAMTQCPL